MLMISLKKTGGGRRRPRLKKTTTASGMQKGGTFQGFGEDPAAIAAHFA
jgi:hypothetical protein